MAALRSLLALALLFALSLPAPAYDSPEAVILSPYKSMTGANHLRRARPHAGVDLAGTLGAPVLAAADGVVARLIDYGDGCGAGVILAHTGFRRWTAYCHMQQAMVHQGQTVRSEERRVGKECRSRWSPYH